MGLCLRIWPHSHTWFTTPFTKCSFPFNSIRDVHTLYVLHSSSVRSGNFYIPRDPWSPGPVYTSRWCKSWIISHSTRAHKVFVTVTPPHRISASRDSLNWLDIVFSNTLHYKGMTEKLLPPNSFCLILVANISPNSILCQIAKSMIFYACKSRNKSR